MGTWEVIPVSDHRFRVGRRTETGEFEYHMCEIQDGELAPSEWVFRSIAARVAAKMNSDTV